MDRLVFDAATLAIALLGAVLGVISTWRNWIQDRVRLLVRPSYGLDVMGGHNICIDVVNMSSFPVTVTRIGFTLLGSDRRMQIPRPMFTGGETLPVSLEARTSCTVLVPLAAFEKGEIAVIDKAYVSTACGIRVQGDSRTLRQLVHAAAAALVEPPGA